MPRNKSDPFDRKLFRSIIGLDDRSPVHQLIPNHTDWHTYVDVYSPGSYEFFVSTKVETLPDGTLVPVDPCPSFYVAVPPNLSATLVPVSPSAPTSTESLSPTHVVESRLPSFLANSLKLSQGTRASPRASAAAPSSPAPAASFAEALPHLSVSSSLALLGDQECLLPGLSNDLTHSTNEPGSASPSTAIAVPFPQEAISLQTQLTRCLGPIDGWIRYSSNPALHTKDRHAQVIHGTLAEPLACRYNMLHFTPVQALGASDSCYSIRDQLCLDPYIFRTNQVTNHLTAVALDATPWAQPYFSIHQRPPTPANSSTSTAVSASEQDASTLSLYVHPRAPGTCSGLSAADLREVQHRFLSHPVLEGVRAAVLQRMVRELEERHGCLSMVDVVLNHTSTDSAWIREMPEATFNLRNSPHLRAAWELDEAIRAASNAHIGRLMASEKDITAVVQDVLEVSGGILSRRLWEYFVLDTQGTLALAAAYLSTFVAPDTLFSEADLKDALQQYSTVTDEDNIETRPDKAPPAPTPPHPANLRRPQLSPDRQLERQLTKYPSVGPLFTRIEKYTPSVVVKEEALVVLVEQLCAAPASVPAVTPVPDEPWIPVEPVQKALSSLRRRLSTRTDSSVDQTVTAPRAASDLAGGVYNDGSGARFSTHLCIPTAIQVLQALPGVQIRPDTWGPGATLVGLSPLDVLALLRRLILAVNYRLYKRYDHDIHSALKATTGAANHMWLVDRAGKEQISVEKPLVWSYFTKCTDPNTGELHVMACNGFIWNGNPWLDFTLPVDAAPIYSKYVQRSILQRRFESSPNGRSSGTFEAPKYGQQATVASVKPTTAAAPTPANAASTTKSNRALNTQQTKADGAKSGTAIASPNHSVTVLPFLGMDLLHMPKTEIALQLEAYETEDWSRVRDFELQEAVRIALQEATGTGNHSASTLERLCAVDFNAIPHLHPSLCPPPVLSASTPYFRRSVVIWGDCIKLRYGLRPLDCPRLWYRMRRYVQRMAAIFHALRLDNAHGTPQHVSATMLDAARSTRPSVYVNGELFTGAHTHDVSYTSQLGITSLVREMAQAHGVGDLVGQLTRYGGTPWGSIRISHLPEHLRSNYAYLHVRNRYLMTGAGAVSLTTGNNNAHSNNDDDSTPHAFNVEPLDPMSSLLGIDFSAVAHTYGSDVPSDDSTFLSLKPALEAIATQTTKVCSARYSRLPALLFDCTHDNETLYQRSDPLHALAYMTLAAAAGCATGTTRGFDILLPYNVSVVGDYRRYHHSNPLLLGDVSTASGTGSGTSQSTEGGGEPGSGTDVLDASAFHVAFASECPALACPIADATDGSASCAEKKLPSLYSVDLREGLLLPRRRLNTLKQEMYMRGYNEVHTEIKSHDGHAIVVITRCHPILDDAYVFIIRLSEGRTHSLDLPHSLSFYKVAGEITDVVMAASLTITQKDVSRVPPMKRPEPGEIENPKNVPGTGGDLRVRSLPTHGIATSFVAPPAYPNSPSACDAKLGGDATVLHRANADADDPVVVKGSPHAGSSLAQQVGFKNGLPFDPDPVPGYIRGMSHDLTYADNSFSSHEYSAKGEDVIHRHLHRQMRRPVSLDQCTLGMASLFIEKADSGSTTTHLSLNSGFLVGSVLVLRKRVQKPLPFNTGNVHSDVLPLYRKVSNNRPPPISALREAFGLPAIPEVPVAGAAASDAVTRHRGLSRPEMDLFVLNKLLFRSDSEERDDSSGSRGVYVVPGHGPLPWAGLFGVYQLLRHIRKYNDLGHPLLDNLRGGRWYVDYALSRLEDTPALVPIVEWIRAHCCSFHFLPRSKVPRLVHNVLSTVIDCALEAIACLMNWNPSRIHTIGFYNQAQPLSNGLMQNPYLNPAAPLPTSFAMMLTSVMLLSQARSAALLSHPLIPDPNTPHPAQRPDGSYPGAAPDDEFRTHGPSISAGVDHFCVGFMRSWGRDTFIAFRGLCLVPERHTEARALLMAFGATMRHGLLPNLMDGANRPRYNCRDALWWWLQALQDYCNMVPGGVELLSWRVKRRFPSDNMEDYDHQMNYTPRNNNPEPQVVSLGDLVYEALCKHVAGIQFREWFAGPGLDEHMQEAGFHVSLRFDENTGLVFGGNLWNCGTWCDKMGSFPGLNKGEPATPRDGCNVEIAGMLYSTLRWLSQICSDEASRKHFPYAGVPVPSTPPSPGGKAPILTWADWRDRVRANFERCFYVPASTEEDGQFCIDPAVANRRGIYKDTFGGERSWSDYQFRANFPVAMAVAPELFTPQRASGALSLVEQCLISPGVGIRTLDPADWAYRGDYDNSNCSGDKSIAGGWNYHQGPEWVWPLGFYFRARLHFPDPQVVPNGKWEKDSPVGPVDWLSASMKRHKVFLEHSLEVGLPELTNSNGKHCSHSCVVQAWSASTLLDAWYDANKLQESLTQ